MTGGSLQEKSGNLIQTALISVLAVACAAQAQQTAVVLRAARMIDGSGAAPTAPAMIRIEGDRIAEVGSSLRIPPGARVVELGDATLLPGLIDLHTHLTGDERVHWEDALLKSTPGRDALWGARNARVTRRVHIRPRHGPHLALCGR
jgi:imidazolonepropionase-like amidohydrolase